MQFKNDSQQRHTSLAFHDFKTRDLTRNREEIACIVHSTPMTLVIPYLGKAIDQTALAVKEAELAKVHFLNTVVVYLNRANAESLNAVLPHEISQCNQMP